LKIEQINEFTSVLFAKYSLNFLTESKSLLNILIADCRIVNILWQCFYYSFYAITEQ